MNRNIVTITCAGLLFLGTAASMAIAQQESGSIMIRREDGGGSSVRMFSMPNFEALRAPDFTRKDLPIFNETLVLSDPQSEAIGRHIDDYLQSFAALTKELASVAGPVAEFKPDAAEGETGQGGPAGGMVGPMGGPAIAFDDLEKQLPPGSNVSVSMMMGMDEGPTDGGEARPMPSASVEVGIETPGGEDVAPELLEQFKQRANELAAKMSEQMMAQQEAMARGEPPQRPGAGAGPAVIMTSPEDMEAHQAELKAKVDEFTKARAKLRASFVAEAQGDLAPEQVERWPALERALTRERSLPKGRIAGESTDLIKVLASRQLPESSLESLSVQVEGYAIDLDGALKRRDAFLVDASRQIDEAMSSGDADKAINLAQKAADLRIAVRKVNQQAAEALALALSGAEGDAFRAAAFAEFYPQLGYETRAQKMFAAIDRIEGVPPDAAAAIAQLRASYAGELKAMNDQIRQVIDREQPMERVRSLERLKQSMEGEVHGPDGQPALEQPEDHVRTVIEKRAEMDDRYLKSVAALLPADMAAGLPKPRTHKGPIVVRSGSDAD